MKEELKPCPFCGGRPEITQDGFELWELACENLMCAYFGNDFETYEEAVSKWNNRRETNAEDKD